MNYSFPYHQLVKNFSISECLRGIKTSLPATLLPHGRPWFLDKTLAPISWIYKTYARLAAVCKLCCINSNRSITILKQMTSTQNYLYFVRLLSYFLSCMPSILFLQVSLSKSSLNPHFLVVEPSICISLVLCGVNEIPSWGCKQWIGRNSGSSFPLTTA